MSTQPVGGSHYLLLGCNIDPLHLRSNEAKHFLHWHVSSSTELTKVALYIGIDMVILA
jgi:hypothetical protein